MDAHIISENDGEVTIQVKFLLGSSMLESEQSILESINNAGTLATEIALKKFDADGDPIIIGDVKFTSRCKTGKNYQTPYGVAHIDRHVYQTSKGGKVYVPLDSAARIVQGATPRFAKILSHKYTNLSAPGVIEDLNENHNRQIAHSYLQNVTDYVGSIAQAKEESWSYELPELNKSVFSLGISLDGAYIPTVNDGFREGMVGTIAYYDKKGERLHTTYISAAPEYGKAVFFERFEREIKRAKKCYPKAEAIGVADGAKDNWSFLEKHTSKQILDFWHAAEYLSEASHAVFPRKKDNEEREEWLETRCHDLKHKQGAATRILKKLQECAPKRLSKTIKENLSAAVTYFKNNIKAGRMKYHKHTENNLPIGSGVIEAACKTIIKQRLSASGMRWKSNGIKVILSLRALIKTKDRWNQFWEKINVSGVPVMS